MSTRRDYSLIEVRNILRRYKKDLPTIKDVKNEIESKLGWKATTQTIWRHIKAWIFFHIKDLCFIFKI